MEQDHTLEACRKSVAFVHTLLKSGSKYSFVPYKQPVFVEFCLGLPASCGFPTECQGRLQDELQTVRDINGFADKYNLIRPVRS